MTAPIMNTARLILTPVSAGDFDDLKSLWADPAFTAAITGRPLTEEEVWFRLLRDVGHWRVTGHGNWSMRLRDGGAYVGSVGVLDFRRDLEPAFDAPELGWGVGEAFQGQGLAREGLQAALGWADTELKAARTVCMIAPDNRASIRLAGRVGFCPSGDGLYKSQPVRLFARPCPPL